MTAFDHSARRSSAAVLPEPGLRSGEGPATERGLSRSDFSPPFFLIG